MDSFSSRQEIVYFSVELDNDRIVLFLFHSFFFLLSFTFLLEFFNKYHMKTETRGSMTEEKEVGSPRVPVVPLLEYYFSLYFTCTSFPLISPSFLSLKGTINQLYFTQLLTLCLFPLLYSLGIFIFQSVIFFCNRPLSVSWICLLIQCGIWLLLSPVLNSRPPLFSIPLDLGPNSFQILLWLDEVPPIWAFSWLHLTLPWLIFKDLFFDPIH